MHQLTRISICWVWHKTIKVSASSGTLPDGAMRSVHARARVTQCILPLRIDRKKTDDMLRLWHLVFYPPSTEDDSILLEHSAMYWILDHIYQIQCVEGMVVDILEAQHAVLEIIIENQKNFSQSSKIKLISIEELVGITENYLPQLSL
ncbi:hypothetical protein CGSHi6P18H1_01804 [Haemophilus influenzae 6P18H1]|nr:hypothetical protein CGSHi6P18H1_01804 [Haemophilus influenzae 6P18H1]